MKWARFSPTDSEGISNSSVDQKVEEAMIGKMILKFHNSPISKPIQAVDSHFKHVGSTLFRSIIVL